MQPSARTTLSRCRSLALTLCAAALLVHCSKGEPGASGENTASRPSASVGATGSASKPTVEMVDYELATGRKDKMRVALKAPKGGKSEEGALAWDDDSGLYIDAGNVLNPIDSNDILLGWPPESTRRGAKPEHANTGDVLISHWTQADGPTWVVCVQKGTVAPVSIQVDLKHKELALQVCRSIKVVI